MRVEEDKESERPTSTHVFMNKVARFWSWPEVIGAAKVFCIFERIFCSVQFVPVATCTSKKIRHAPGSLEQPGWS
jgi:hypothetical protein